MTRLRSGPRSSSRSITPRALAAAILLAVSGVGCAIGPNNKAPEVEAPENYRGDDKPSEQSFADLPWWEVYRDPTLFLLLKSATEKNYDLRIALERVQIARQSHRAAAWALAPTIWANGGIGDGVGSLTIPGPYPPQDLDGRFGIGAGVSWEPDVWGRLRRLSQVAKHRFEAADEDRRGVYITLVGDVADLYFSLSAIDQQLQYATQAVTTRRDTLALFEQRASGGVGNDLEVARAQASLQQAVSAVVELDLTRITNENALNYLLARRPGPIENRTPLGGLTQPPQIPAGLPSTLLKRRPDIRASEQQLLAANARIGAEMADFFPKFELTAFLGVASPDLQEARMLYAGAGLFSWTMPFLGGERERAEYEAAKSAFKAAVAEYERTVLNAFREVADALAFIETLRQQREAVQAVVTALETAERLAVERYRGGVADYLDVLTVQEQLLISQLRLSSLTGQQLSAVSRLYRNLGGGWPIEDEEEEDEKKRKKKKKG